MRLRFQFTHPGRGATQTEHTNSRTLGVSIHAPREGCDVCWLVVVAYDNVSIHAPREGCDGTPLRRSARGRSFNSRTPGGVRHHQSGHLYHPQKFQFTHPGRGATEYYYFLERLCGFNSRTPGGVRHYPTARGTPGEPFQFTHPGRGATISIAFIPHTFSVSIHAPREGCDTRWEDHPL